MIVFRQVDGRYPVFWETSAQPAGRWHAEGEGPAHYFADTPDGAWAEFLRHEEITDPADLATIRRQMWAVEIGSPPHVGIPVPENALGDPETYPACQDEARRLRQSGADRLAAPSAALRGGAGDVGGLVVVLFGSASGLTAWIAADAGRPAVALLERVRHFGSS